MPRLFVAIIEHDPEALPHSVIKEQHLIASYCGIKRAGILEFVAESNPWKILENPTWNQFKPYALLKRNMEKMPVMCSKWGP